MPNRDKSIDLINTPMERAFKRFQEETAEAIEALVPKQIRSNPVADAMRLVGIRKQDIR